MATLTLRSQSLSNRAMSFDRMQYVELLRSLRLNPFRTGRCLSTDEVFIYMQDLDVSIPFEQGDVFRHAIDYELGVAHLSQSLSNRAMSFDE